MSDGRSREEDFTERNPLVHVYAHLSGGLGAVGLANMLRDLLSWQDFFADILDAWDRIVRPLEAVLFGWIDPLLPFPAPSWLHDYLLLGLLFAGGALRGQFVSARRMKKMGTWDGQTGYGVVVAVFAAWPLFALLYGLYALAPRPRDDRRPWDRFDSFVFFAPVLYFLFFVMANYAFLFAA